jgi:hypothetical protein
VPIDDVGASINHACATYPTVAMGRQRWVICPLLRRRIVVVSASGGSAGCVAWAPGAAILDRAPNLLRPKWGRSKFSPGALYGFWIGHLAYYG